MIHIQDTLVNPINQPMSFASLHIQTVRNGGTLLESYADITTKEDAQVDFTLVQGDYRVYLKQSSDGIEYPVGYISKDIFGTVVSPTTLAAIIVDSLPEEISA